MANKLHMPPSRRRYITSELVLLALAILSGALVIWMTVTGAGGITDRYRMLTDKLP